MFRFMFLLLLVLAGCQGGDTPMNYSEALETTLNIIDIVDNDINQILVVTFEVPNNKNLIQNYMRNAVCALKDTLPEGYTLRLGAKLSNSMTVGTATVSESVVRNGGACDTSWDITEHAEEYSL